MATVMTMIVSGVETKGHVINHVTTEVGFREGFLAVTNIIFAYRMSTLSSFIVYVTNPLQLPMSPTLDSCLKQKTLAHSTNRWPCFKSLTQYCIWLPL